ncbi:MAG: PAS domain-containing protein [Rhodospirillales bacterium]|nr:PAS domain-containing protein [Rhodospirillales bacterium]
MPAPVAARKKIARGERVISKRSKNRGASGKVLRAGRAKPPRGNMNKAAAGILPTRRGKTTLGGRPRDDAGLIRLLGAIAEAAGSAATVPDMLRVAVEEVCRFLKWPVGHAFVPFQTSSHELVSSGIWHLADPKRFEPFRRVSKNFPNIYRGLIGRAVVAKKAVLTPDIADKTAKFIYLDEAKAAGLTSGIVLPVTTDGRVIAVLEFYTTARTELDATLLATLDQIAHHVGRVAERVLARADQRRLFDAIEEIGDGIALYDKDERLLLCNRRYATSLSMIDDILKPGLKLSEEVAALAERGHYVGAGEGWVEKRLRAFRALEPIESHQRGPDGQERWFFSRHHRTRDGGTLLVRTDITRRKQAEAERESARQLLQTALDSIADGVALFDKDERLVLWNENYTRNFSTLRGLLKLGITFPEIVNILAARQSYVGEAEDFVATRLGKFRALETSEIHVRDSEGSHWLVARHYRTRDGGTLLVLTEITDRVTAMREIERARDAAERASEAKTRFLASMSHEFRTPLNAILGFAQMLEIGAGKITEAKNREYLAIVLKSGQHLLDLVTHILDLAGVESGAKEIALQALAPAQTVRECVDMVREEAVRREVKIINRLGALGSDVRFWGDPVPVRQILINLLSNAVKYNRPGGQVTLSCAPNGAGRVRFTVADTGMGISPDRHDEVFQPFRRLGREAGEIEGSGIGLALSRQLVQRMGGKIGFASAPGQGSTFWFELPGVESEVKNDAASEERG